MTSHELAKKLLEGPDLPVRAVGGIGEFDWGWLDAILVEVAHGSVHIEGYRE